MTRFGEVTGMNIVIDVEHPRDDTAVINVAGELDVISEKILRRAVTRQLEDGYLRLIINAAALTFCDSHGLWVLLQASRQTERRGGSFRLAGPTAFVRRLLTVTHIAEAFPVDADVTSALEADRHSSAPPVTR